MGGRERKGEVLDEGGKERRIGTEMEEQVGERKGEGVKGVLCSAEFFVTF